jgi:hypothetical protein
MLEGSEQYRRFCVLRLHWLTDELYSWAREEKGVS